VDPAITGSLVNTTTVAPPADVTDPDTDNNSATDTDTLVPSADLSVLKTGPASAIAGTNVTYTLLVTNQGPSTAQNVVLQDPTPAGTTSVSADSPCAAGFPCALGALAPGATVSLDVIFAIGSGVTGSILNVANVSSDTPDPDLANNDSS